MEKLINLFKRRDMVGNLGAIDYLIKREISKSNLSLVGDSVGSGAINFNHKKKPKVSVIMTAFNSSGTISKSIDSVISQSLSDIELIVVDDFSSDNTVEIVNSYAARDSRVTCLRLYENRGTYWAKNLGILHSKGEVIALHDSDDISEKDRLSLQYDLLINSNLNFCYTNWIRVDKEGSPVLNRGLRERLGYPTLAFKKEILDDFGFFDTTRIAADDEFHSRIKMRYGAKSFIHLNKVCYVAPLAENSLTGKNPVHMDLKNIADPLSFLSDDRKIYVERYKRWHENSGNLAKLSFPARFREFPISGGMRSSLINQGDLIIGSIATYPPRKNTFEKVVKQIIDQVDILRVHLNGYEDVPDYLNSPKIIVTQSKKYGDLRDNGKFLFAENLPSCFHITFDDDLNYPKYYVSYLVAKCMQYGCRAIVGLHGTLINKSFARYHDKKSRSTKTYRLAVESDFLVNILGTGTTCYHSNTIKFGLDNIGNTGMVDLWFARYAKQKSIPMICISRGEGWLSDLNNVEGMSLYNEYLNSDDKQTQLVFEANLNSPPIGFN
ncbi:glycosyltransferase family A protein [Limnohabitans sp. 15K]|uniref:glycosyltransferase family 2 protein n=1 Tax=Limnohabitans sp. 15K TaxID=1100706 RepID=UPI000C1DD0A0|nr:glycosyltransferase family A protein [Limnohabitans sp. 15K]PIT82119.1 hypothetical protein B9Z40_11145 [Limnohabitans sp. 15K]